MLEAHESLEISRHLSFLFERPKAPISALEMVDGIIKHHNIWVGTARGAQWHTNELNVSLPFLLESGDFTI